jgi:hypothetical protein
MWYANLQCTIVTVRHVVVRGCREIVTDEFDALYAKLKEKGVTVSALLARAVAEVLKKHPILNAAYDASGAIKYNKDINIAMAVAIDGGLITPTIVRTSEQDLFAVSRAWKDLVARAKAKKLTPAEYSSGTIHCPAMNACTTTVKRRFSIPFSRLSFYPTYHFMTVLLRSYFTQARSRSRTWACSGCSNSTPSYPPAPAAS